MAKILDLTRNDISYNIKILKEKGIIERVGLIKNESWKINILDNGIKKCITEVIKLKYKNI